MKTIHFAVAAIIAGAILPVLHAADGPNDKRPALRVREVRPHPAAGSAGPAASVEKRETRAQRREDRQQRRIEEGIRHDQLTPDEIAALQKQEQSIQSLQNQFKADGKLTREEGRQLEKALNEASLQIWGQRHDTEGNQKPVSRLGKDVFANDDLTSRIESGTMTRAQAREFLEDFRKLVNIKRRLSSDNLTPSQRLALQAEYNTLLNQYFSLKA